MNLVTLVQAKRLLGISSTFTTDDALLTRMLIDAEHWAERTAQRSFKPSIETRYFDWCDAYNLYFDDDLLEVIAVTNGDADLTDIPLSEFVLHPRRMYPKYGISLARGSEYVYEFNESIEAAIRVKAAWGYHDDWNNAWINSLDIVADIAGINDNITTITVNNVDGANINADSPRFSTGMLIKIGSEWMEIIAANNSITDTLAVIRGARGSTATAHAVNTPIYTFSPARGVVDAILGYVHWRYNQKNDRAKYGSEIPKDIINLLPYPMAAII